MAVPEARTIVMGRRVIDGNKLLTDTYTALNHFAVWPNEAAARYRSSVGGTRARQGRQDQAANLAILAALVLHLKRGRLGQELDGPPRGETVPGRQNVRGSH